MKNMILVFVLGLFVQGAFAGQGKDKGLELDTKDFSLEYKVVEGKAVCWQTCRHSRCEEVEYEVFVDFELYKLQKAAEKENLQWVLTKACYDEQIAHVDDHMPLLAEKDGKAAAKIVREKGTQLKMIVYSKIQREVDAFLRTLVK